MSFFFSGASHAAMWLLQMILRIGCITNWRTPLISYMVLSILMVMATFLGSMEGKGVRGFFQDVISWTSGIDYVKPLLSGQKYWCLFPYKFDSICPRKTTLLVLRIVSFNLLRTSFLSSLCISLQIMQLITQCLCSFCNIHMLS